MLLHINTELNIEYLNLFNDMLLFIIFIIILQFFGGIIKYINLIKTLFIFLLIKHLLFHKFILIS